MSLRHGALMAGIAVLALILGFAAANWLRQPVEPETGAAQSLLSIELPDTENRLQSLKQFQGKTLVVNFWATWCPPCRDEIPHFVQAQRDLAANNVQFVGIALDDPVQVAAFALEMNINYPILMGGLHEQEALRKLGNPSGGLPYTLIFDKTGQLREKIIGGLDQRRLQQALAPHF